MKPPASTRTHHSPPATRAWPGAAVRRVLLALTALTVLVASLSSSAPVVRADTQTLSGTIDAQSPTFTHLNPPCGLGSVSTHYRVVKARVTGTSASQFSIKVTPTGFRANITLYQGVFLPEYPIVNCWGSVTGSAAGASVQYSTPLVELLEPFTYQDFYLVVAGNSAADLGSFDVEVSASTLQVGLSLTPQAADTTAPVLHLPANITREATGADGATVSYTATAQDAVDGAVTPSCTPVSGSVFPVRTTSVTCVATDAAGNSSSGSFAVTVVDTTAPALSLPDDLAREATGAAGATVTYTATAHDAVEGALTPTCLPASGSVFPLGDTAVNCTAADAAANSSTASFTVSVADTTAPALHLPHDITQEATGTAGAIVGYAVSADDLVDGEVAPSCAPASGSTFPVGETTVSCTAADTAGNSAAKSFTIGIVDTTAPLLSPPEDVTQEATGADGATVSYVVAAQDAVDGAVAPSCSPASGSVFPIGEKTVTCTATDSSDNSSTTTFAVRVVDATAPVLNLPDDLVEEAASADGATVSYTVSARDTVDGTVPPSCAPASGDTFPIGSTTVDCTATDAAGNSSAASFTVTVADTAAPVLHLPEDILEEATSTAGATVDYLVTADDLVDGSVAVTCLPGTGSVFPIGDTTVACTAADASGNTATAEFAVTVTPFVPPEDEPTDDDGQSDDEPGQRLPMTGSFPALGLAAASILLLAGGLTVAWSRRRAG